MRRGPADLTPAPGIEAAERMEEDSYQNADNGQNRGMDDPPENDDQEESNRAAGANDKTRVSLFA